MFSRSTSERQGPPPGVAFLLLVALSATLSVWKKYRSEPRIAPAAQLWPDGYSGNGGVTSAGGAATGVAGSKSGVPVGSATGAGLPSLSASRMAVIGRQVFQWYLLFQHPIAASAAARFSIANRRALSAIGSPRYVAMVRNARFHSAKEWSCQKIAASVWSAVRVVLVSEPTRLISLRSRA